MKNLILILLVISLISCEELLLHENINNMNIEDFETTWQTVNSIYPLLEYKRISWDSIYTVYRPLADAAKGDEIYTVLSNMLKELKDGHAQIKTKGGWGVIPYLPPRFEKDKDSYNPLVVRNYFSTELKVAGQGKMEYEYLTSDIGYIYISSFSEGNWVYDFDSVLRYLSNSKSLIVDVRNNPGGSSLTYSHILSRFIEVTVLDSTFYRDYIKPYTISPSYYQYLKPVVILINGASESSAEIFPSLMKYRSTTTLIGDTTSGLGGGTYLFTIPSGKEIQIIQCFFKSYNGRIIEGNGLAPDIRVEQTESDAKMGVDRQLEYARDFLSDVNNAG